MEQEKRPGIAEAIEVIEFFYDLMLTEMDKEPNNMIAIMHDYHQKLIHTLQNMERASLPEPEDSTTGDNQRTSTGDSKNGNGSSPSRVSKAASSEASFATVRGWLERIELEHTSASEAKLRAGPSSSRGNTANSTSISSASLRARPEGIEQEHTSASEAKYRAGAPSSHGNTANSTKASFASLRRPERDTHEYGDRSGGGDTQRNP